MATVLTIGTFDLFHAGHVDLLRRCQQLAGPDGKVIVGLNTDEFVEGYKGEKPVISFRNREDVLYALGMVHDVFASDQPDGSIKELLDDVRKNYGLDILAVGSDWADKDYYAQIGIESETLLLLERVGLVYLPRPKTGISTTEIKVRISGRNWG